MRTLAWLSTNLSRKCSELVRRFSNRWSQRDRFGSWRVWFSLSFELNLDVDLSQLAHLEIDLNSDDDIALTFGQTETQDNPGSAIVTSIRCWATGLFQIQEAVHNAFSSILSGDLDVHPPSSISDSPFVKRTYSLRGDGSGGLDEWEFDPSPLLPDGYEQIQARIYRDLNDAIERAIRLVYWRSGTKLPRVDLRRERFEWSIDGERWRYVPRRTIVGAASSHNPFAIRLNIGDHRKFESLVRSGISEPVGHDVFLEAWQLRRSVPRAAIVLGIAAAEVGLKECLGKLAPDTVRLLERLQSPPIVDLLKNYLPTLEGRNPSSKIVTPPQSVRRVIAAGVETRNRIAHRAVVDDDLRQRLTTDNVEALLLAVSDLLWFLDYYTGEEWALDHVRPTTLAEWRRGAE